MDSVQTSQSAAAGRGADQDASPAATRAHVLRVFAVLTVLTVVEVAVVYVPGVSATLLSVALSALAVAKAALVLFYFMHLGHERRALRWGVLGALLLPALFAAVLIGEAAWRAGP